MKTFFGNVNIDDFEKRTGWKLSKEDREFLIKNRSDKTSFKEGKFHIFDKPFCILAHENTANEISKILLKYDDKKASNEELYVGII